MVDMIILLLYNNKGKFFLFFFFFYLNNNKILYLIQILLFRFCSILVIMYYNYDSKHHSNLKSSSTNTKKIYPNINNGFISDLSSDSTATTNTSSPTNSYISNKKSTKNDLIYTVSDKYSNDNSSRRNSYENDDVLIASTNPNHNKSSNSIVNNQQRDEYQIKMKRNNKSEPAYLGRLQSGGTSANLLNPSSIIIDASSISSSSKKQSSQVDFTSKLNRLNKIRTADLIMVTHNNNNKRNNDKKSSSSSSSSSSSNKKWFSYLKSPFIYVPLVIFLMIAIVGILAGATYLILFKSLSLINTSGKNESTKTIYDSYFNTNSQSTYLLKLNGTEFNRNLTFPGLI
jgi:hypothetical protein